jgi:hypothetical protein
MSILLAAGSSARELVIGRKIYALANNDLFVELARIHPAEITDAAASADLDPQ